MGSLAVRIPVDNELQKLLEGSPEQRKSKLAINYADATRELYEVRDTLRDLRENNRLQDLSEEDAEALHLRALKAIEQHLYFGALTQPSAGSEIEDLLCEVKLGSEILETGKPLYTLDNVDVDQLNISIANATSSLLGRFHKFVSTSENDLVDQMTAQAFSIDIPSTPFARFLKRLQFENSPKDAESLFRGDSPVAKMFWTRNLQRDLSAISPMSDPSILELLAHSIAYNVDERREELSRNKNILNELGYHTNLGVGFTLKEPINYQRLRQLKPPYGVEPKSWIKTVRALEHATHKLLRMGISEIEPGILSCDQDSDPKALEWVKKRNGIQKALLDMVFKPLQSTALSKVGSYKLIEESELIAKATIAEFGEVFGSPAIGFNDETINDCVRIFNDVQSYMPLISAVTSIQAGLHNSPEALQALASEVSEQFRDKLAQFGLVENDDPKSHLRDVSENGYIGLNLKKSYKELLDLYEQREALLFAANITSIAQRYLISANLEIGSKTSYNVASMKNDPVLWKGIREGARAICEKELFREFAFSLTKENVIKIPLNDETDISEGINNDKNYISFSIKIDLGRKNPELGLRTPVVSAINAEDAASSLFGTLPQYILDEALSKTPPVIILGEDKPIAAFMIELPTAFTDKGEVEKFVAGYRDYLQQALDEFFQRVERGVYSTAQLKIAIYDPNKSLGEAA